MVNNDDYDRILNTLLEDIYLSVEEMSLSFEQIAIELVEDRITTDKNITVEEAGKEITSYYSNKELYSDIYSSSEKKRMEKYNYQLENLLNITAQPYYLSMLKGLRKTLFELKEPTTMAKITKSHLDYIIDSLENYKFDEALELFEEMFSTINYKT